MNEKSRGRILVIDDEASIRESLMEYFCDYGFSTVAAGSAEEGLELLRKNGFELVVVDVRLPGINGDQFVCDAHALHPRLKFIIHTGSVHFRISESLGAAGLNEKDIFLKPVFDLDKLLDRVKALLSREET